MHLIIIELIKRESCKLATDSLFGSMGVISPLSHCFW